MGILRLSSAAVNAELDALTSLFDVGGTGIVEFRTGPPPATVADISSGTLVATSTLNGTAFQPAVNGVAVANNVSNSTLAVVGGPFSLGHARITDASGVAIMDCDVGVGVGFTVNITNSIIVNSGESIITQDFTLTQGGLV